MGADLYLEPDSTKNKEEWQPKFDEAVRVRDALCKELGRDHKLAKAAQSEVSRCYDKMYPTSSYFRDSYNSSSVLWRLGLSWWGLCDKIGDDGTMSDEDLREFIGQVKAAKVKLIRVKDMKGMYLAKPHNRAEADSWNEYYEKKHRRLIRFLQKGLKPGKKIRFSV